MAVGVLNYPAALDDAVTLVESANGASTVLTAGYTAGDPTLTVASNVLLAPTGLVSIESIGLILSYTGKSSTTGLTGVTRASATQEPNNPADTNVASGSVVDQRLTSGSLGVLRSGIIQLETLLGTRAAPAQSGVGRADNGQWYTARNLANSADLNLLRANTSNEAEITPTLNLGGALKVGAPASALSDRITVKGSTADNTQYSWYAVDSNGFLTSRITNNGRLDLVSYASDGGIIVGDYLPATPTVNTRAVHYAGGNKDAAGSRQTIGLLDWWIRDLTAASVDSEFRAGYMVAQNCTSLSNQQPNTYMVLSAAGSVLPSLPLVLGTTPASAGDIRLPTAATFRWRNNANSADINGVGTNSTDQLLLGAPGGVVMSATITDPAVAAITASPVVNISTTGKQLMAAFPIVIPAGTVGNFQGIKFNPVMFGTEGVTSNSVTNMSGILSGIDTNAAYDGPGTLYAAYNVLTPTHAGGGTITTYAGMYSNLPASITRITNLYHLYLPGAAACHFGGNVEVVGGLKLKEKAGAVVDGDFTNPVNGMMALDSTNSRIYVRFGGTWKSVTLT